MANTTNFGWETPDDTDLVKDGALAMRTLGNAIDASLVDLKGGTTDQILAKNSNTDMDFKWIANDVGDITAVTAGTGLSGGGTSGDVTLTNTVATTFDAKGDLVVGTGADTFAKLTVGTNGHYLVADSSTTTGLKWEAPAGGGGLTSIASGNLSGSEVSITSIPGTYKSLQLVLTGISISSADQIVYCRYNSITTNTYVNGGFYVDSNGANVAEQDGTYWNLAFGIGGAVESDTKSAATVFFPNYTSTNSYRQIYGTFVWKRNADNTIRNSFFSGNESGTGAITSIQIAPSGGTFDAGTYVLYGVN